MDDAQTQHAKLESMAALLEQMEARAAVMHTEAPGGSAQATRVASYRRILSLQRKMVSEMLTLTPEGMSEAAVLKAQLKRLFADNAALLQEGGIELDAMYATLFDDAFDADPELVIEGEHDDDFGKEAGTGGGYDWLITRPIYANDGIARRIVSRFRGKPIERISVILEETRSGVFGKLMRYDDSREHGGRFHRHLPGWPDAGKIDAFLDHVRPPHRNAVAVGEIRRRYTAWEVEVFGQEGGDPK